MNLTKGYQAESIIDGYSIVQFGTSDNQVTKATDKTAPAFGVVGQRGAIAGEHVDVTESGEQFVRIGAAFTAGQKFTTNVDGHAIPVTASAGQTVHVVGIIKQTSASVGAVLRCNVCPSMIIR